MKNLNQKVFAIVNKKTEEIVAWGLNASTIKQEWDEYFVGTEDEQTHILQQTFMSQEEMQKEITL